MKKKHYKQSKSRKLYDESCVFFDQYENNVTRKSYNLLINGINEFRNMLLAEDLPTEDVDELLLKIIDKSEK